MFLHQQREHFRNAHSEKESGALSCCIVVGLERVFARLAHINARSGEHLRPSFSEVKNEMFTKQKIR